MSAVPVQSRNNKAQHKETNVNQQEQKISLKKVYIVNNAQKLLALVETSKSAASRHSNALLTPRLNQSPFLEFTPMEKIKSSRFDKRFTDSAKVKTGTTICGTSIFSPKTDDKEVSIERLKDTISQKEIQIKTIKTELAKVALHKAQYKKKCTTNEVKLAKVYNALSTIKKETKNLYNTVSHACTIIQPPVSTIPCHKNHNESPEIKYLKIKLKQLTAQTSPSVMHQRNRTLCKQNNTMALFRSSVGSKKNSMINGLDNLKGRLKKVLINTRKRLTTLETDKNGASSTLAL